MNVVSSLGVTPATRPAQPWGQEAPGQGPAHRNGLLKRLRQPELELIASHLQPVSLETDRVLELSGHSVETVYFPESGLISVVAHSPGLGALEVGMIGLEGMTGMALAMGSTRSRLEARVQLPVKGHAVRMDVLAGVLDRCSGLRHMLVGYAGVLTDQFTQTALVTARATIDVRVARRLLMTADRLDQIEMPLTHDVLATALCVRRPGVTDAIHRLEGQCLIRARRSSISIRDRAGLEALAGGSYGGPEREYARLFEDLIQTAN